MSNPQTENTHAFSKEHAARYDKRFARLAPVREALHLLTRQVLAGLPEDARVLCVGAGTGAEVLYLGQQFPGWRFTAVDPADAMLDVCRKRTKGAGLADRCTFHAGYLDSLPASEPFDAATSILVSQFILQPEERSAYFRQIATRLKPEGLLVSADLATGTPPDVYQSLLEVWLEMQRYTGAEEEQVRKLPELYGRNVAVSAPEEIASLIAGAGFGAPTLFYQALLIHAWYARRGPAV